MASGQMSGLQTDRRRIAVACMEFWEWADSETQDGIIVGITPAFVDDLTDLPGFFDAMVAVGWLVRIDETSWEIPNFLRHNGLSAKKRALDTELKRKTRSTRQNVSGSETDKCPDDERTKTGPEKRREEKRRGDAAPEDQIKKNTAAPTGAERSSVRQALIRIGIESGAAQSVALHPALTLAMVRSAMNAVAKDPNVRSKPAVLLTRLRTELDMAAPEESDDEG